MQLIDGSQHPITWKPSADSTHLIGHMILKKHLADDTSSSSSATILGLKVVGGRIIESGRLGAIIEKVKKGSIADTIGRLRPGLLSFGQIISFYSLIYI